MINEILSILGGIFIIIFALVICNKFARENEKMAEELIKEIERNKSLSADKSRMRVGMESFKTAIKTLKKEKQELFQKSVKVIQEKDLEILKLTEFKKELIEINEFDNELLTKRTEIIEFMENKIVELDDKNCELKIEVNDLEEINHARYQYSEYLRKKIHFVRAKRLLKVVKGERLGLNNG